MRENDTNRICEDRTDSANIILRQAIK